MPKGLAYPRELGQVIEQVLPHLAPDVVLVRYNIGNDWSDEPALFFRVVLSDAAARKDRLRDVTTKVANTLVQSVDPIQKWGLIPYFSFRSQSEQAKLKDPAWT